jgi:hypothetical protein
MTDEHEGQKIDLVASAQGTSPTLPQFGQVISIRLGAVLLGPLWGANGGFVGFAVVGGPFTFLTATNFRVLGQMTVSPISAEVTGTGKLQHSQWT